MYRDTDTNANVEQAVCHEPLGKEEDARFCSPVYITCHSIRKRLVDVDAVSAKAAIDAIVKGKILADDTAYWAKKITYTQEKGNDEKTLISISTVDDVDWLNAIIEDKERELHYFYEESMNSFSVVDNMEAIIEDRDRYIEKIIAENKLFAQFSSTIIKDLESQLRGIPWKTLK